MVFHLVRMLSPVREVTTAEKAGVLMPDAFSREVGDLGTWIDQLPFVDHHCHAPLRPERINGDGRDQLRATFTESGNPVAQQRDVPDTLVYRTMIRDLARLLGSETTEAAVLAARQKIEPAAYHAQLAKDAGLAASYDDFLFSQADCYPAADWAKLIGLPVRPILRIETQAEQLLASGAGADWPSFRKAFTDALDGSMKSGGIAFKSIAAYRSGLALDRPEDGAVNAALDEARRSIERGEHFRLAALPLVTALVWATFEYAAGAPKPIPIQFHVGLGDDDVYLPSSNPALMRQLFREPRFHEVPVVLLHNYPYVRDAAYLANIYPNVYLDLGLTLPLAGYDAASLIRQALGLAPVTKILASSDGHAMPEFQWFAIHHWRRALTEALNGAINDGWVAGTNEAVEIAKGVLAGNAQRIYTAQPPAAAKPAG